MSRPAPKPVVHLELHSGDRARARDFYAGLFGWQAQPIVTRHGSYLGLDLAPGLGGGIVECPARPPVWLPYVEVEDIAKTTALARRLGAAILLEPREGPAGWRSVVATSTGGEIALWKPKHEPPRKGRLRDDGLSPVGRSSPALANHRNGGPGWERSS